MRPLSLNPKILFRLIKTCNLGHLILLLCFIIFGAVAFLTPYDFQFLFLIDLFMILFQSNRLSLEIMRRHLFLFNFQLYHALIWIPFSLAYLVLTWLQFKWRVELLLVRVT